MVRTYRQPNGAIFDQKRISTAARRLGPWSISAVQKTYLSSIFRSRRVASFQIPNPSRFLLPLN